WNWMRDSLWPGIKGVWDNISLGFVVVKDSIVGTWNKITGKFTEAWNWVSGVFKSWWAELSGFFLGRLTRLRVGLSSIGTESSRSLPPSRTG
ncbi:hypothetical protein, partial [Dermacoccus nishinomiyaensis]|uniref:hypothetical protein n=1 Tax=Dermacoccus nishinomiyaensis TaxID=1274 RepID=UPI001C49A6E0